MSTPREPDWTTPDGPSSEDLRRRAAGEDLVAASRDAVDASTIVNSMTEGTTKMIETLITRVASLTSAVEELPNAFASTADHIKRGADATEKLAHNTERTAKANQATEKSLKNQRFSVKEMVQSLARGDLQGALAEAFQGLPGADNLRHRQAERMSQLGYGSLRDRLSGRPRYGPVTASGEAGAVAEGIDAPGLLSRFGVAGAAGGLGLLASLWSPAAIFGMYKLFGQTTQNVQTLQRTGALTGEGAGAGIAATGINIPFLGHIGGEAWHLRGGPFDLINDKEATQIVQGVRGSGYRGAEARGLEESIKNMVNDLGVGVEDAMNIAIPAIKEAGFSTEQLSEQMSTLDDTAKAAHISIGDLTKTVGTLITSNAQFSRDAAQRATGQFQSLERQFQGSAIARTGGLAQFQQGTARESIATLNGFAPYEAYSTQFNKNFQTYFTRVLVRLAQAKPNGMDWQEYVAMMMLDPMWQQLFGNTPYPQIGDMLRRVWRDTDHGRNTQGYLNRTVSAGQQARMERITKNSARLTSDIYGDAVSNRQEVTRNQWQKINVLDREMSDVGISKPERFAMERAAKNALRGGDLNEVKSAMDKIAQRIEEASKNFHAKTTIDLHPRASRFFNALNTSSIEAARGTRSKQGTVDTP